MGYLTRFKIGLKSGFDSDSSGNVINSIIDSSKVFTFSINPRTQSISFGNLGTQKTLLNGASRVVKNALSEHKKRISLSQQLMTDTKYEEFVALIIDSDEDIVVVDDDENVYVTNLISFDVQRRSSTQSRLVAWSYSMVFDEV